jgi:hypothetical protein
MMDKKIGLNSMMMCQSTNHKHHRSIGCFVVRAVPVRASIHFVRTRASSTVFFFSKVGIQYL